MADTKPKHTHGHSPGPWHRNIKPATKYTVVWSGRNNHVARVDTIGKTPEEVEANICLIQKSPELLSALELIMYEFRVFGQPTERCLQLAQQAVDGANGIESEVSS